MTEKKRIFISRHLSSDSPIRKVAINHYIKDQSLIHFSPLAFEPPESDWIFFYSRNAVRFFFEKSNLELYPYLYACMSNGTAEELGKYVLDISFIGNGNPKEVALQFDDVRKNHEPVCFVRANNSVDSIHNLLKSDNTFSVPVYDNQPIEEVPVEEFDILIFTSPMNADVWFDKNEYRDQQIIVIGSTTKNAVLKHVSKEILVANEPSEYGISKLLLELV